ncbi:MAG: Trehalose utilization [Bryobacterales bacterium]|nr:Trehalose utilization [Bryobacterales bacterium]
MKRLAVFVLWSVILFVARSFAETSPIQVLLVDGQSGGPYHNWQLTTQVLKKELEDSGRFRVTVATSPQSDGDFSNFKPEFSKYPVVVFNYDAPDWPTGLRVQFERYMENGGGLVVVHAADNAFPNWPAFNQMIGIGGWRERNESAGASVVLQGWQAGLRHFSGIRRLAWQSASFPDRDTRAGTPDYERAAARLDARCG